MSSPALIGMQCNRGFALLGIRYVYVDLADVHTRVASVTDLGISDYRPVRGGNIGKNVYFVLLILCCLEHIPGSFERNRRAGGSARL